MLSSLLHKLSSDSVFERVTFAFGAYGQQGAQVIESVRDELVVGFDHVSFSVLWLSNALKLFQADALEITLRSILAH